MIIRPPPQWPIKQPISGRDGQIVDAGMALSHPAIGRELPVFVAIGAKPVSLNALPFVGKTHGNPIFRHRPKFFDQAIVLFACPFPRQQCVDCDMSGNELVPIAPFAIIGIGPDNDIGVTRVPCIFGKAYLFFCGVCVKGGGGGRFMIILPKKKGGRPNDGR